jgi:hypothetical protein
LDCGANAHVFGIGMAAISALVAPLNACDYPICSFLIRGGDRPAPWYNNPKNTIYGLGDR